MQGSLNTHSNIYRAMSALFFPSFEFKASPEGLNIKKLGKGWGVENVQPPWTFFRESSLLGHGTMIESKCPHFDLA